MDINLLKIIFQYNNLEELIKIGSSSKLLFKIIDNIIQKKYKLSLSEISNYHCIKNSCKKIDDSSVYTKYCENHVSRYTCDDCYSIDNCLKKVKSCADHNCCYKFVCIDCKKNRKSLKCFECKELYNTKNLFRKKYKDLRTNDDVLCEKCYDMKNVSDKDEYKNLIEWYGISQEEHNRRYGNITDSDQDD
jgi:hypothetical protein